MASLLGLDLNLLVALDALLRHGSVSGAARELSLSQPAVSRSLDRLRAALGDPLFVRAGRGLVPTARARGLVVPVSDALVAVRQVFEPPADFDPRSASGTLQFAAAEEWQVAFGARVVAALADRAPGVDLRFRALSLGSADEARRGTLDLAVSPDLSPLPAVAGVVDYGDFVTRRLYDRAFVGIARLGTPPPDLAAWLAGRHAIVSFEGGGVGFVDALLAERGHHRRVLASLTSFTSVAALVHDTDLFAVVPAEIVDPARFSVFELPIPLPTVPMLLMWHPRRTTEPRHRFFRELVADVVSARFR